MKNFDEFVQWLEAPTGQRQDLGQWRSFQQALNAAYKEWEKSEKQLTPHLAKDSGWEGFADAAAKIAAEKIIALLLTNPSAVCLPLQPAASQAIAKLSEPLFWVLSKAKGNLDISQNGPLYDTLILLVGYSPIPAALSVLATNAKHVYFLETPELQAIEWTRKRIVPIIDYYYRQVLKKKQIPAELYFYKKQSAGSGSNLLQISDSTAPATFAAVQKVLDAIAQQDTASQSRESRTIAIDVTGGKNPMMGGTFTALSVRGECDIIYVDALLYDPSARRPVPGTEYLGRVDHPDKVFSQTLLQKAYELFDRHRYKESADLLQEIHDNLVTYLREHENVPGVKETLTQTMQNVQYLKTWADTYKERDSRNYKKARETAANICIIRSSQGAVSCRDQLLLLEQVPVIEVDEETEAFHFASLDEDQFEAVTLERFHEADRRRSAEDRVWSISSFVSLIELIAKRLIVRLPLYYDESLRSNKTKRDGYHALFLAESGQRWGKSLATKLGELKRKRNRLLPSSTPGNQITRVNQRIQTYTALVTQAQILAGRPQAEQFAKQLDLFDDRFGHEPLWHILLKGEGGPTRDRRKFQDIFSQTWETKTRNPSGELSSVSLDNLSLDDETPFPLDRDGHIKEHLLASFDQTYKQVAVDWNLFNLIHLRNSSNHGFGIVGDEHLLVAREMIRLLIRYALKREKDYTSDNEVDRKIDSWKFLDSKTILDLP